jgi:CheY-like chemotaxis protein
MNDTTLLVVEDNADDFLLLKRAMRNAKLQNRLQHVDDGDKAVQYLSGKPPYDNRAQWPMPLIVLLDLKLPRRLGFEVLEWIRSQEGLRRLPVVVLTSSDQSQDVNKAYDLGANSYLVKPGTLEDLTKLTQLVNMYWVLCNKCPDIRA